MGAPMASHLLQAGHELTLWSHNARKAHALAEEFPANHSATPAGVAEASEFTFLCVGDTAMSRKVILGDDGIVHSARNGSVVVDCSTISPIESASISAKLLERQISFLDAPCSGSKAGAENGALTFMIGGELPVFERVRPLLEALGKSLYYCGGPGMGLRAKLTQNLILGNLLQAFNEGFVLSAKAGLDPELMLEILNNSAARSGLISSKAPAVFRRDFSTNFSVKWLEKDLGMAVEFGGMLKVPLPLTALSQQMLRAANRQGLRR